MYKHILIAADGSKTSTKAVRHGLKLAKSVETSKVTIVTVTEMMSALAMSAGMDAGMALPFEDYERDAASAAEKILSAARKLAEREDVPCQTEHIPDQRPSEAIVAAARKKRCNLIVMGSHGRRGIDRLLLGSQASEVLTNSTVPVLVVK